MNIRDLKYLVAIAEFKHFSKAAEACYVSQPGLSMQIKKLEETLGVQLIERSNKQLFLTEVGETIVKQAQGILSQVEALQDTARLFHDPFSGGFNLAIIPTLAPYILPKIMPFLSKAFPPLIIYLFEEKTADILAKLEKGQLDAAMLALPISDDYEVRPLFEEPFLLAVHERHPLAKKKTIQLSDLEQETLWLLEEGHCFREQALSFCHQVKAKESERFRGSSLETIRYMVAAHGGITLMPELACQKTTGICYLRFEEPQPSRTIGLVYRPSTAKKKLLSKMEVLLARRWS